MFTINLWLACNGLWVTICLYPFSITLHLILFVADLLFFTLSLYDDLLFSEPERMPAGDQGSDVKSNLNDVQYFLRCFIGLESLLLKPPSSLSWQPGDRLTAFYITRHRHTYSRTHPPILPTHVLTLGAGDRPEPQKQRLLSSFFAGSESKYRCWRSVGG